MIKYLLLIGLVLFVSRANAGGYGGGYGHRSSYGMVIRGYGDGGYGSSSLMAGLLGAGSYGKGGYGRGYGGSGYGGYGGGNRIGYGGGRGDRNIAVIQTPVVEYQNVVRNVPTIEYQNVPQVHYQTQTIARQVPIYSQTYPGSSGPIYGPSSETGWLTNGNSAPVYSGGSSPIYSTGSQIYSSSGSAPVYASGGSNIPIYQTGSSGTTVVRGDGTYIPSSSNQYLVG